MRRQVRIVTLLVAAMLLAACATQPLPPRVRSSHHALGTPLSPLQSVYLLYPHSAQYDPLRSQAAEIANSIARQLRAQGVTATLGKIDPEASDSLSGFQRDFSASGARHLLSIKVDKASLREPAGRLVSYEADISLSIPGQASSSWNYRASAGEGVGHQAADVARDLIAALQDSQLIARTPTAKP